MLTKVFTNNYFLKRWFKTTKLAGIATSGEFF